MLLLKRPVQTNYWKGSHPPQGIPNTDSLSGVNLGIGDGLGGGTGVGGPPKPSPCVGYYDGTRPPSIREPDKLPPGNDGKCTFDERKICRIHHCLGKEIKVSTTRWGWREKQKCYGNIYKKITKLVCMARKSVPKGSEISSVDTVFSKRQRDIQGGGISYSESLTHSSGIKTFLNEERASGCEFDRTENERQNTS